MDPKASANTGKEKAQIVIRDAKDFILYGVCIAHILVNESFAKNLKVISLQVLKNKGQKP